MRIQTCDVTGCGDFIEHFVQIGPCLKFGVCNEHHKTAFMLAQQYDKERLWLDERFFNLFYELKGGKNENPD